MTAMPGQNCGLKTTAARMGRPTPPQIKANHQPWKTHSRVEPILGIQQMGAGNLKIGTRSLARAKGKIGWRNLADNIDRYCLRTSLSCQRRGIQAEKLAMSFGGGTDGSRFETNNRNFARGHSILTQNNVNLKFSPLKCDF